jgi:hypothetical protein
MRLSSKETMNSQLIEIASWRLVSELHRRHPTKFTVIETHPCSGQYDCLSLFDTKQTHLGDFNRKGRLHVFNQFDHNQAPEPFDIWREIFSEQSVKKTLDKISSMLGMSIPSKLAPSTASTLVYRFIAEFLTHSTFGVHQWECRNGFIDTSGYGGGVAAAFEGFAKAQARLRLTLPTDVLGNPAYRFWFIYKNKIPVLCIETNGTVWDENDAEFTLADLYASKHSLSQVVMEIAGDLIP